MINNYFAPSTIAPADRILAHKLQGVDAVKENPGRQLSHMATKLAEAYLLSLAQRRETSPSSVALFFEVEDADDAAISARNVLVSAGITVETACFWMHRRKSSFDRQIVDITRVHAEDIGDVDAAFLLQPGPIRPEAVRAFLVKTEGRLDPTCPVLILTSWCSPDLIKEVEALVPEPFFGRLAFGFMAEGKSSAESVLYNSTRFSSPQRQGFPTGWEKNDFYPKIVRMAIERKMKLDRGSAQ